MPRRPADVMIQFTVSREERQLVQGRAAAKRLKLGQYIRLALNTLAFEEDEDAALLEERGIGRPRLTSRTPPRPAAHIKERKALAIPARPAASAASRGNRPRGRSARLLC